MRNCFVDYETRAIADLCDYYGKGLIITRINVPKAARGKGIGTKLLLEILKEADESRTTLYLEIQSSDGLDRDQLEAWYERHGFKQFITGMWRRRAEKI